MLYKFTCVQDSATSSNDGVFFVSIPLSSTDKAVFVPDTTYGYHFFHLEDALIANTAFRASDRGLIES